MRLQRLALASVCLALAACSNFEVGSMEDDSRASTLAEGNDLSFWMNLTGSKTVTATIPDGAYRGRSVRFTDDALVPANIVAGVSIFGVLGTASGSTPACSSPGAQTSDCTAPNGTYWSSVTGTNVTGADGQISVLIPAGYYTGAQSATVIDSDLLAANIRSGTTILGVLGTLSPAPAACTDGALNAASCSTAANRYVSSVAGSNVAVGGASATIPAGYYDGTSSCQASDADLTAANVRSGVTIMGTLGTMVAAHPACGDGSLNAAACSTVAGRYVTATLGSNVSLTSTSATIPAGFYDGTTSCLVSDPDLVAANVRYGVNILGVVGSSSGLMSNMHRTLGAAQITVAQESVQYAGVNTLPAGYRAVPSIASDNDGVTSPTCTNCVDRTGWGATTCGLTGTIAERIIDCAAAFGANATWDGALKGNTGQAIWKLVARKGNIASVIFGKEVWQDQRTGLLWSSIVARDSTNDGNNSLTWCKASGSNFIAGNPAAENDPFDICDNATYQNIAGQAISACYEDGGVNFTSADALITNADDGKAGLHYTATPTSANPSVSWRLPTKFDYMQAEIDGVRFVLPDMAAIAGIAEWTATVTTAGNTAYYFNGESSVIGSSARDTSWNYAMRCVGR